MSPSLSIQLGAVAHWTKCMGQTMQPLRDKIGARSLDQRSHSGMRM